MAPIADPEARREYQRAWLKKRRDTALEGKACVECGTTSSLEFDHRDPASKDPKLKGKAGNGAMWSWSTARLADELAKCQILCHDCHRAKTRADQLATLDRAHGTPWMYKKGKCKCDLCRAWNAESKASRLARQKMSARVGDPMP